MKSVLLPYFTFFVLPLAIYGQSKTMPDGKMVLYVKYEEVLTQEKFSETFNVLMQHFPLVQNQENQWHWQFESASESCSILLNKKNFILYYQARSMHPKYLQRVDGIFVQLQPTHKKKYPSG